MKARTNNEVELLLYLEECTVRSAGRVKDTMLDRADLKLIQEWADQEFLEWRRIDFMHLDREHTHCVRLSPELIREAHQLRIDRACDTFDPLVLQSDKAQA